ncbi:hypothetical protein Q7P37_011045 [Cladosporium fusiforme]
MTVASQKRMLTAPNSKLTKTDIIEVLRKDDAWATLSLEKRQQLYSFLPPPQEGQEPYDPDVNPLESPLGRVLEDELRRWQDDVKAGRESKKWRDEAMKAGRNRMSGKLDQERRSGEQGKGRDGGNDGAENVKGSNEHDGQSSPFTLILDNLEQSGQPLLAEYAQRANAAKVKVVFLSFETLQQPQNVDTFIPAWNKTPQIWQREVAEQTKPTPNQSTQILFNHPKRPIQKKDPKNVTKAHPKETNTPSPKGNLLILDVLNPLATTQPNALPTLLSSLINPATSILALYHRDMPLSAKNPDPYSPSPLTLLHYLATTLITTYSLPHVLARKAARERSVAEPTSGLEEGVEGVLQGLGANGKEGLVMEVEHRRKSGRGVREWYFLPQNAAAKTAMPAGPRAKESVILLEDHPAYRPAVEEGTGAGDEVPESTTFELGLTERQRQAREGVVLPYYDAQKGGVEGGRILYDMGEEDDFDEEEDEI